MESPITSFSLAPAMDVLVTTHTEKVGLYTWANELIFGSLENIVASSKPISARLPRAHSKHLSNQEAGRKQGGMHGTMLKHSAYTGEEDDIVSASSTESEADEHATDIIDTLTTDDDSDELERDSKEARITERDQNVLAGIIPVAPKMITLSMLPRSQWLNLVHIDSIKTRNKPIEPPKKPEAAPFFLPTVSGANAGRDPVFDVNAKEKEEMIARNAAAAWGQESDDDDDNKTILPEQTRIHRVKDTTRAALPDNDLTSLLLSYRHQKTWKPILEFLMSISPSNLDMQLRSLDLEAPVTVDEEQDEGEQEDNNLLVMFLTFLADAISSDTHFEFLQALLRAFILIHGDTLAQSDHMKEVAKTVEEETHKAWNRICNNLQHTQCLVGILGSMHQT